MECGICGIWYRDFLCVVSRMLCGLFWKFGVGYLVSRVSLSCMSLMVSGISRLTNVSSMRYLPSDKLYHVCLV